MSNVKIEVFYQTKTIQISLNKEDKEKELYNIFIDQLKKELNINDEKSVFKLMAMNTKEMYLMINKDNFNQIINEKTKEGIIKLFLDISNEKEEDDVIEPLGQNMISGINNKNYNDDGDDFNDKLSLSDSNENNIIEKNDIDKTNNEKIENIKNIDKENNINNINNINNTDNNISKDINKNKNIENNFKNEELILQTTPLSSKSNNDKKTNLDLNFKNDDDMLSLKKNDAKDNIIDNKIDNNIIENKNEINDNNNIEIVEICTICQKVIKDKIKYDCCICDKCVLCTKCENNHPHPCIKFKIGKTILSNLCDCHSFISQKQKVSNILPIKYIKNIFNNTYDIILQLGIDNHIEIRPNKTIEIPITIKNYSEYPVNTKDFILIVKNYVIVDITFEMQKVTIEPKNYIKINLKCVSTEKTGREIIKVEVYSTTIKIRESKFSKINIEMLVSNDEEDEEINKKFMFYPKIQLLNKLRKKMLLYIIDNHFCEKSVTQIYDCLCENNWNLDDTITQLNNQI